MAEFKQTTPRLKASPMASNPDVSVGIGEKGGISLYFKGNRFPVTMWETQLRTVLSDDMRTELEIFMDEHADLLAERTIATAKETTRLVTVNSSEIALLDKAISAAKTANDLDTAIKYATLKKQAADQGGKLRVEDLIEINGLAGKK